MIDVDYSAELSTEQYPYNSSKIIPIGVICGIPGISSTDQINTELNWASRLKESENALYQLILSDILDLDKSEAFANLADVFDRMGKTEEALAWFDKGIALEQVYCRFEVTEKKAEYLSHLGHNNDAIGIYESLLKEPFLRESEKVRVRKAIQNQQGRTLHGWK